MDKRELVQIIENFAPLTLAELWDCSGWLVETNKTNVNKIMLCLTGKISKLRYDNFSSSIIFHTI